MLDIGKASEFYATQTSDQVNVRVKSNKQLIASFGGPMRAAAAVTFIEAMDQERNGSPMSLELYLRD